MHMIDRGEAMEILKGPLPSVYTPFYRNGSIDFATLRNFIDFLISAGSKVLILTYGDSLFSVLTDREIGEVTKMVAEHAAGRATVVAADRKWWTGKEIEFAQYARSVGADILMVYPPDWACSCTPNTMAEHYAAVAEHLPVMVVTDAFKIRSTTFAVETIEILMNNCERFVAVKDDVHGELARRLGLLIDNRLPIFSGGWKFNHMNAFPYGCNGYLSNYVMFKPEIARAYCSAIESQDFLRARGIISTFEMPYFDLLCNIQGGMDAGLRGTLELFGVSTRWRRKPYYSLSDDEMEKLADFFKRLSLL